MNNCFKCNKELETNEVFIINKHRYCREHYIELNRVVDNIKNIPATIVTNKPTVSFDTVEHPSHYQIGNLEVIDVIRESMSKEKFIGYLEGNIKKYIFRWEHKNGIEDLKKARKYTDFLIKELEKPL